MKLIIFVLTLAISTNSFCQNYKMLIGTYNTDTVKNGIFLYEFNKKNGDSKLLDNISLSNPSFITVAPTTKHIYAVSEISSAQGKSGWIAALQLKENDNKLILLNTVSSMGSNPCHITTDASEKYVIAANYTSGNFSTYSVNNDGSLLNLVESIQHTGNSIDSSRQKSPHAHGVFFDKKNTNLYVTDLGTDKVMCYQFNNENGKTTALQQPYINAVPGSGTRHLALHPGGNYMYVLQELTGMISVYINKNNQWELLHHISSELPSFKGKSSSAAIVVSEDGKFLYTSNRGPSNNIGIFKINKKTGELSLVNHQSSIGIKPRNINFDPSGKYLLVANQDSNNIIVFKRNKKTGLLTDIQKHIKVPKPACITWIKD